MKKKNIIITLALLIILITLISACTIQSPSPSTPETQAPAATVDDTRIKELENQILLLMQSHQLSENERKQEIASLQAEIQKLKDSAKETAKPPAQSESETQTEPGQVFKYTLDGGRAIITSIACNEEAIVIPSVIDGYQVYGIGSEALSSGNIKRIVISDGIEKLDWFAFKNCASLSSVTIPSSVTSIGYGAFDNAAKGLTIVCQRDSFAHRYAQSYGLTYDIT